MNETSRKRHVADKIGIPIRITQLKVFTSILEKVFETKRKVADGFKETMRIWKDTN